ncbi:acyl-coenzyme A thioesterase PaaI-like protein [Paraburkholderia bryophila]|uniref:Acyl-coenzyme A thioesterase PaaI-like protein n=1 Tax=Paraburkholderia bryophila TaxID=420952 RepID=A0A7Y9WBN6_9BURK|nr:acyl-coenzyme A thioesterase PaaI-like protein [Paraburkholderia bryophila]
MDRPVRHERLRFYLAGALAIFFGLLCHRCLVSVVEHLGIATWIHFDHPVTQPILLGEVGTPSQRWSTVTLADGFTDTNVFLTILSAVLTYYFARVCYHLDVAAVMDRRARWLLGG